MSEKIEISLEEFYEQLNSPIVKFGSKSCQTIVKSSEYISNKNYRNQSKKEFTNYKFLIEKGFKGIVNPSITFNICEFHSETEIEFIDIKNLNFTNSKFTCEVIIFNISKEIKFDGVKFEDLLEINSCPKIEFQNSENKSEIYSLTIRALNVSTVANILDVEIQKQLLLNGKFKDITIGAGKFNRIKLSHEFKIETLYLLGRLGSSFKNLEISELKTNRLQLFVQNLEIRTAKIDVWDCHTTYLTDKNRVIVQNVEFLGKLNFKSSTLDKITFNDVNFRKSTIQLDHSNLLDVKLNNIIWPRNYKIHYKRNIEKDNKEKLNHFYRKNREIYRQLKLISKNQSNTIDALGFYKNEMKQYFWYSFTVSFKELSLGNRIILLLDFVISNFGQSWFRPLICFFVIGWLFYFGIYKDVNGLTYSFTSKISEWQYNPDAVEHYFHLLNPTHKTPSYFTGYQVVLDFFMRVFGGLFIYHIVKASRKYAKL